VIEEKLNAVQTVSDLERVLIEARSQQARVIDFNMLMREQFEANRLVREQFNADATAVMEDFARRYPALTMSAEAANLASCPALVLAVARLLAARPFS
jgi:hypothetical protein